MCKLRTKNNPDVERRAALNHTLLVTSPRIAAVSALATEPSGPDDERWMSHEFADAVRWERRKELSIYTRKRRTTLRGITCA